MKKVCLLIIDPQFDFCDPTGKLFVPGADLDMVRLSKFIEKNYMRLDDIQLTLDSHHRVHIAHAISWLDEHGKHPASYTVITAADVDAGKYKATYPAFQDKYVNYVHQLEANGRYVLCIWPEHCLIGSVGATIYSPIFEAVSIWEGQYAQAGKTTKGSNLFTEHYSAVKADVIDNTDVYTKLNTKLTGILKTYDDILVGGEARNFCLANTVKDISEDFGDDNVKKLIILEDATSPVQGNDALNTQFTEFCNNKHIRFSTTKDYKF